MPRRDPRLAVTYAVGVGACALGLFSLSLAPTVTAEDSGELIAAAWHFGIPHPPGYPLWTMLCGAFLHVVPLGSVAMRANLFSAVCTAGAAVVTYAAIRELKISRHVAAAASLVWVWSRWSWSQGVITEVYGLHSLLIAGLLWCALRWNRRRRNPALVGFWLLMGLGMSNHHTTALVGLALAVWILARQPGLLRKWRLVVVCLGVFLSGLLPYLYLPLRARTNPVVNWGDPSTSERFWEHVSRQQYGAIGPTKVAEPRSLSRFGSQLSYVAESVCDDLTPWLAGFAVAGICLLAWRERWVLLLVLLWLTTAGVLFVLLANCDLDRTSRWVMRVFLIPVSLGLVIPLAFLVEFLAGHIRKRVHGSPRLAIILTTALIVAGPALQIVSHWKECNYSNYWYAHDHARAMLSCTLPRAMLFPSGDHNAFPLVYLVMVTGERADVLIADIYGYVRPELCEDRPKNSIDAPDAWLIKSARRPVYFTTKKKPPVADATFVPAGILYHLLPSGMAFEKPELPPRSDYRNTTEPTVMDLGAHQILCEYEFFAGLADLEGGRDEAALAHFESAAELGEGIKENSNNIGSALAEFGRDDEAIHFFNMAAQSDSRYTLPRWNLFRLLRRHGQWHEARRRLEEIIQADPDDFRAYGEMGFLLRDHGRNPQEAVRFWQESLRRNPAQPAIIRALSDCDSNNLHGQ